MGFWNSVGNWFTKAGSDVAGAIVDAYHAIVEDIVKPVYHTVVDTVVESAKSIGSYIKEQAVEIFQRAIGGFANAKSKVMSREVAKTIVAKTGASGIATLFDECQLSAAKKEEAVRATNAGNTMRAGELLLEATHDEIAKTSKHLSAEAGGRRILKSVHGSYLRAVEPEWRVDMVKRPPKSWEHWYMEDWHGKVVLKGRGAPNKPGQFLRVHRNCQVDLSPAHPAQDPEEKFCIFKNDDGSWSFLSAHGTWLSARENGSVSAVGKCDTWEHFWLEWW